MPLAGARSLDPFRILRRHIALIIGTGVAGVVLGVAAFFLFNEFLPLYRAEVLFEIRSGLAEATDLAAQDITQDELVMRLATTETMLLMSRGVLESAVKQPDVQTTRWFGDKFVAADGTPLIDEAVDELEEDIARKLVRGSNLFGLSWATGVDSDVPIVLNSIARSYIRKRAALEDSVYNANLEVFTTELSQTNRQLDDLSQETQAFIREKGITNIDDPRSNQLSLAMAAVVEQIANTGSSLSLVQTAYMQTAAKLEGTVEPTEDDRRLAEQDAAVRPHELAVLQAKTTLRELREQYRDPTHWLVRKEEGRLRAFEMEYEVKIGEIMTANLRAQLKALADQIQSFRQMREELDEQYDAKDSQLRTLAADMSRYKELEDERGHLEAIRDIDLELIKEVRLLRARADAARVRLAQEARTPREKSFPKLEIVVPLTTILIVGLVTGLIFLREITDQRVKSASDLAVLPGARVLGVIPELDEDPCKSEAAELVVRKCPHSVLSESYRQACTQIDKAMSRLGHQTLVLVGGLPGAGTTTVATNLAAAAAAAGRKVVVVDANFRRPRLGEAMDVTADGPGLGDVLMEKVALDESITRSDLGIDLIMAGRPASRVFERLNNGQFDSIIAELRSRYDLVLVDAPPAVVAGDALVLASKLDAAVLVVRANQEQRGLVARLISQLSDAHCEMLGILLNRPRGTAGGYFKKNFSTMAKYATEATAHAELEESSA
jgi:capsular exopolysaccharide synthesis family protein